MNNYVFIINEKGERISSMVETKKRKGEVLLTYAKEQYPDATAYISGDDSMLDEFIAGKVYVDGIMVAPTVAKPSAAEIKKAKVAEIKAKYEEKFKLDESALVRARLAGNDKQVEVIQARYKSNMSMMAKEIKEA